MITFGLIIVAPDKIGESLVGSLRFAAISGDSCSVGKPRMGTGEDRTNLSSQSVQLLGEIYV